MNYRDLIRQLGMLSNESLDSDVVFVDATDEIISIALKLNTDDDVFNIGYPILVQDRRGFVEYRHNNSGGNQWLSQKNYDDLIAAGWEIGSERYANLPQNASRYGLCLADAVKEWQRVTGKDPCTVGCPCCGPPHQFEEFDGDGNVVASGPTFVTKGSF